MMFDKIHAQRLTALADHLERAEKLLVGTFDFGQYRNECGTAGCAIGEASLLWPQDFYETSQISYYYCGSRFFDLGTQEYAHLFIPGDQEPEKYGGEHLNAFATRHEVAANIRAFLEYKAREQAEGEKP